MSAGEAGWSIFLLGLPFAPLLNRQLDLWHGQTLWADVWVGLLSTYGIAKGLKPIALPALGAWSAWIILWSGWAWMKGIGAAKAYPVMLLMPLSHVLVIVLFILAATSQWTPAFLERLLNGLAWTTVGVVAYGYLQWMDLDEFLKNIQEYPNYSRDLLVGWSGNPSHFAAYLSISFPLLLRRRGWFWKAMAFGAVGLLAILVFAYHSVSGAFGAFGVLSWWVWQAHRRWIIGMVGIGLLGAWICWSHPLWFNPSGRLEAWKSLTQIFHAHPLTGSGPGYIREFSITLTQGHPFFGWRHAHNEIFHFAIEYGLIGLGLMLWALVDMGRRLRRLEMTPTVVAFTGIGIAFFLNSLVNFPAHLWLPGALGLTAYCGIIVLSTQRAPA